MQESKIRTTEQMVVCILIDLFGCCSHPTSRHRVQIITQQQGRLEAGAGTEKQGKQML